MIDYFKKSSTESTKKLWEDDSYRTKVVTNATGIKRSKKFKKEQSIRAKEWYKENPEQRDSRSITMKQSWADGKIEINIHSIQESKMEIELREKLAQRLSESIVHKKTIRSGDKWYYPDIIIGDNIIIEYYGNFWHGNPNQFKDTDIVHHSITAKEIWDFDKKRIDSLRGLGYTVYIIWEEEYIKDKEECINNLIKKIRNEDKNK
jgi:G:T-mismatch repair DNA endonuclease (very short patch repair protein)